MALLRGFTAPLLPLGIPSGACWPRERERERETTSTLAHEEKSKKKSARRSKYTV